MDALFSRRCLLLMLLPLMKMEQRVMYAVDLASLIARLPTELSARWEIDAFD